MYFTYTLLFLYYMKFTKKDATTTWCSLPLVNGCFLIEDLNI